MFICNVIEYYQEKRTAIINFPKLFQPTLRINPNGVQLLNIHYIHKPTLSSNNSMLYKLWKCVTEIPLPCIPIFTFWEDVVKAVWASIFHSDRLNIPPGDIVCPVTKWTSSSSQHNFINTHVIAISNEWNQTVKCIGDFTY